MKEDGSFFALLVVLGILFIFFLIGRELICWYFKYNRQVELLEKILIELRSKNGNTGLGKAKILDI